MIDTDDFLVGLILEDQRMVAKTIFPNAGRQHVFGLEIHEGQGTVVSRVPSHIPFFSSEIAEDLLAKLERRLPQSQPVAMTAEMPLSPSLKRAFDSAKALQTRLQHNEIEPLHLLAAILRGESSQGVKLLQDSGITQESVLLKLGSATGN